MDKITIDITEISSLVLNKNEMQEICVVYSDWEYCFKIYLKDNNRKIVIFSNGAIDPEKNTSPVYMRSSWAEEINASTIFLDDPTIHGTNMRLGWGQGKTDMFSLEIFAKILKELLESIDLDQTNTYFYGSSAGGFMSLYYSILFPESTAIVNNPQTKVLNYLRPYVRRMLKHSYAIEDIDKVPSELVYRLDINKAIKYYNIKPKKVYYLQNILCESDVENHLTPFLDDLKKDAIELSGLCLISYFKKGLGHNPLPKNTTLNYIDEIINERLDMKL